MNNPTHIRHSLNLEPQFLHHGGDVPEVDFFGVVQVLDQYASPELAIAAAMNTCRKWAQN